jgi:hypothetical protein
MTKPLLIVGIILLFLAVEAGRMWYCREANKQTTQTLQAQSQNHIDSLASAEIDARASDISGEWAARIEQEQQLQQALKDSIAFLKEELALAKYGNLTELVGRLGETGIRKEEKNQTLSVQKMAVAPWADLRIFLETTDPGRSITVKITRPLKNTESVTWKTGEVYYLKDIGATTLIEVYIVRNTATQAQIQWRHYSGFAKK